MAQVVLTTPERLAHEKFRERQQAQSRIRDGDGKIEELDTSVKGKTPLGPDPVEGPPIE